MLTRNPTEERLRGIIAGVALVAADSFGADDDLGAWGVDSLSLLRALAEIESEFGIVIPDEEFAGMRTLNALVAAVDRRAAALHQ